MKSKLLLLLSTSLFIAATSCGHITVYDAEWCGDLGKDGAHCAHTLTDKTRDIAKPAWDVERIGWMCSDSTGYNDTETALDQFCSSTNLCDYETRQAIDAAKVRIREVVRRALAARKKHLEELNPRE